MNENLFKIIDTQITHIVVSDYNKDVTKEAIGKIKYNLCLLWKQYKECV